MFCCEFTNQSAKWRKHTKCIHEMNRNTLLWNLALTEGLLRRVTLQNSKQMTVSNATKRLSVLQLCSLWNSDDILDIYLLFVIAGKSTKYAVSGPDNDRQSISYDSSWECAKLCARRSVCLCSQKGGGASIGVLM